MTVGSNPVVGLPPELTDAMDRHNSSGTIGLFYPGTQLNAVANGALASFTSSMLLLYADAVAGTRVPQRVITATAGAGLGTVVEYMLLGEHGFWRVGASSTGAGAVPATTGLYSSIAGNTNAIGVFKFQLGDVNAAATCTLDNDGANWLPTNTTHDWEVSFGIADLTNTDQAATVGFAEFGVCTGAVDDDPANGAATYYAQFKIAADKVTAGTETTSLSAVALNSDALKLTIRYVASQAKFYFDLDGVTIGGVGKHASMTAGCQVFVRVSHLAAYAAATDAPISVDLDYVVASQSYLGHRS